MIAATPVMATYPRLPVAFVRGEGAWLWDASGRRYLDAVSGIAVCSLGHAHPAIAAALAEQARTLVHTSNLYRITLQEQLAARLTALAGMDGAFFCNSGAEANEAAMKIARLHGHACRIAEPQIIVMDGSFHGRTLATLSATGNRKVQAGFEPLVQGFLRVPYGDTGALAHVASTRRDVAALLLEPLQGEGGVIVPPEGYLSAARELCDRHGWLMICDEVQTGMCRTGRWFACQHWGVLPDVMTLAKSLGNGVPIGACLARGVAAQMFQPGSHGSTFGGNPLACRAALAVIEVMEAENLARRAADLGALLFDGLRERLAHLACVRALRGRGLMVGVELDRPCEGLVSRALTDEAVLINVTSGNVVRLLPPLICTTTQIELLAEALGRVIRDWIG